MYGYYFLQNYQCGHFRNEYYNAFNNSGFSDFFNIEIALITLLMISTEFLHFLYYLHYKLDHNFQML